MIQYNYSTLEPEAEQLVEPLAYELENRGFESSLDHGIF
jgi:hypothetical protein